jgi:hypothetical protein
MRTFGSLISLVLFAACAATPAPPPASGPAGRMELRMGNCAAAVPGAVTTLTELRDGVALDITAVDLGAAREIVARAKRHAAAGEADPAALPHTGEHGGGEGGHCPIVHRGTRVTVTEIGGGVRVEVIALDPAGVAALIEETRERVKWLDPAARGE